MKKTQETIVPEIKNLEQAIRPKSLRPTPSLNARKSLKPKLAVIRPIKIQQGPVVG